MKKVFAFILVSVCVFFAVSIDAFADIGPKDSVTIYVKLAEDDREYYIALLEKSEHTYYNDKYIEKRDNVWKRIYEFSQSDEFNLFDNGVNLSYRKMKGCDSAVWGYHPPRTFKILLYFPDSESFLVSEVLDKYAFDSYFTVDVNGDSLTVAKNGGARGILVEVIGLLIRTALTVLIEIGVAFLFEYSGRRELKLILITNIITQILLNVFIAAGDYSFGAFGAISAYIAGEIAVFIAEAIVYSINLPRITEFRTGNGLAVRYAFTANLASFLGGGALLFVTDFLFGWLVRGWLFYIGLVG